MPDPGLAIGGETRPQRAVVLAVPAITQRDREFRLRPLFAEPADDRRGGLGRQPRAVPAIEAYGASKCCLRAASDPDRDRFDWPRQHAHLVDHCRDVARWK